MFLLSDPCAGKACYGHTTGPCNNVDSNGVGICMCADPDKQIDAGGNCVGKFPPHGYLAWLWAEDINKKLQCGSTKFWGVQHSLPQLNLLTLFILLLLIFVFQGQ